MHGLAGQGSLRPRADPWGLLHWTGLPQERSDQNDAATYAVLEAEAWWGPVKVGKMCG